MKVAVLLFPSTTEAQKRKYQRNDRLALRNLLVRDRSRAWCNSELYLICAAHHAPVHGTRNIFQVLSKYPRVRKAILYFSIFAAAIEFPFCFGFETD